MTLKKDKKYYLISYKCKYPLAQEWSEWTELIEESPIDAFLRWSSTRDAAGWKEYVLIGFWEITKSQYEKYADKGES